MHIVVDRSELLPLLNKAERLVGKSLIPFIGLLNVVAGEKSVQTKATNLDIYWWSSLPAEIIAPGQVAFSSGQAKEFLDKVAAERVSIRSEPDGRAFLVADEITRRFDICDPSDLPAFPDLKQPDLQLTAQIPELGRLLKAVHIPGP